MKYGFIYIWLDRKHKRYYVGSHWGTEEDGYICSCRWMKRAYKRRPQDFKRRILTLVYTNRSDLLDEEYRWLSFIKDEELKIRYYNAYKHRFGHWSTDPEKKQIVILNQSAKLKQMYNSERGLKLRKQMSENAKIYWQSEEGEIKKKKLSDRFTGKPLSYEITEDMKKQRSDNSKRLQKEKKIGMHGKKHSEKTLKLMSINNAMNDPKYRDKIGEANRGTKGLWLNGIKKMAKPETEKWNLLISEGYLPAENL